ncbi:MAG: hypothetical protein CM1200mP30_12920 [Pseudomonadota bacterium]|nr:MAG: hypothetical protein CM1200mP30_12920 [Pseudomonadota bacterium]
MMLISLLQRKFDDFFGLSEVYYNVMETTLNISPKTSGSMNGIREVDTKDVGKAVYAIL